MENYIARALDSVLMQKTNFDVQIIISDDGSVDGTAQILEQYKERVGNRVVILYAEENKGLIENFVKALKYASGKYIATLDADDYWIDENKLQRQVDFLESHTDRGFVFTNYYNEIESNQKRTLGLSADYILPGKTIYESFLLRPVVQISTPCFRRSLLDAEELDRFVARHFEAQDYPLFLSFALKASGKFINEPTTVYTVRQNSMSNQKDFDKWVLNRKNCNAIGDYFLERHPISKPLLDQRNFEFNFQLLLGAWRSKDFENVTEYLKPLSAKDFAKYNKKAWYIYHASKNRWLYNIVSLWVLRKRG